MIPLVVLWWFLADDPTSIDPISTLLQWGALGLVLMLLLTGGLWAKPSVTELLKRQDAEREMWETRILPAMTKLSNQLDDNNKLLSELVRLNRRENR